MSSETSNTGERDPIYESPWRCDILERSLHWDELQNHPDVDDGFGDRTPACREYTPPRENSDSRIYATIPGQTIIGPVLQVHSIQYIGINGIDIQIPSTTTKERNSWVVICRGTNRYEDEWHLNDPDHSPTSSELLLESLLRKKENQVLQKMEQPSIEETHAKQFEIQTNPAYY